MKLNVYRIDRVGVKFRMRVKVSRIHVRSVLHSQYQSYRKESIVTDRIIEQEHTWLGENHRAGTYLLRLKIML